jgi:hypothetical protein
MNAVGVSFSLCAVTMMVKDRASIGMNLWCTRYQSNGSTNTDTHSHQPRLSNSGINRFDCYFYCSHTASTALLLCFQISSKMILRRGLIYHDDC